MFYATDINQIPISERYIVARECEEAKKMGELVSIQLEQIESVEGAIIVLDGIYRASAVWLSKHHQSNAQRIYTDPYRFL